MGSRGGSLTVLQAVSKFPTQAKRRLDWGTWHSPGTLGASDEFIDPTGRKKRGPQDDNG